MKSISPFRVGTGYDVHRLVKDRDLFIGCVKIPYEYGLLGHSDADVLAHAIADALFGACGLRDIGYHFPDTDDRYKDMSGSTVLSLCADIVRGAGYEIVNVDSTVIAQKPKLAPYIEEMRKNIAAALSIEPCDVSVKAKTEEGLGFTGEGLGIASQAVCLVVRKEPRTILL